MAGGRPSCHPKAEKWLSKPQGLSEVWPQNCGRGQVWGQPHHAPQLCPGSHHRLIVFYCFSSFSSSLAGTYTLTLTLEDAHILSPRLCLSLSLALSQQT